MTDLIQAPVVLQPLMLKQLLRARSHRRVLVKTLIEERGKWTRKAFRNRRALVFDYPEHHLWRCISDCGKNKLQHQSSHLSWHSRYPHRAGVP
jgi:hypothetical protein